MDRIDAATIAVVIDTMAAERAELLALLGSLSEAEWAQSTECPEYRVKGIAAHILGDDLSLLSRQRDGALPGLFLVAEKMAGADIRQLLDAFNDQWVEAARFMSPPVLLELLGLAGQWTLDFYRSVDPGAPCEPVPLYSPEPGEMSPYWQAIAREYLERWTHHAQIRRALGRGSLAASPYLDVGLRIVSGVADQTPGVPADAEGDWAIGPLSLGPRAQAADILTLAHSSDEVRQLVPGPPDAVASFAERVGRRPAPTESI